MPKGVKPFVSMFNRQGKKIDKLNQEAQEKLREDEKELEEKRLLRLQAAEVIKAKASLKIEEQVFGEKIVREIGKFDLQNSASIQKNCDRLEMILDDYYKLQTSVKVTFGDTFEVECTWKDNFEENIKKIEDQIRLGRDKIADLNTTAQQVASDEKSAHEKLVHSEFVKEQKFTCNILSDELEMRCTALIKNCNVADLEKMTDYQILECHKNRYAIDTEMREIFEKFSAFSKVAALCPERDTLASGPRLNQKKALDARNRYAQKLHSLMIDKDISEEKLRNATTCSIELSKFQGYDSKLDIYSFKTEFERLIQPTRTKRLWVDTLKNNYLSGPAFTLVERTETLSEIWDKLIGAYGNVKLLLQNKISQLDELENLGKVKTDEKLVTSLSKVINMMSELKSLAEKHGLETKLYVGGGLEKVLSLLGEERERKFFSKNVDSSSKVLSEKEEWENLSAFLQKERSVREKLLLVQKSKESLGISPTLNPKGKQGGSGMTHVSSPGVRSDLQCFLCGEAGHTQSVDKGGNIHVDYVSCKLFVDSSCAERLQLLLKQHLCMQCLSPGIKYNETHNCVDKYVCNHEYHQRYKQGLHVLLCERHKNRPENLELLKNYMENFIKKRSSTFQDFTKNISLVCHHNEVYLANPVGKMSNSKIIPDIEDRACFQLQTISIKGQLKGRTKTRQVNMFYDGGCGDMVISKATVDFLLSIGRATLLKPGPLCLKGVNDQTSISEHGVYEIILPLSDGTEATFSGICLDKVTADLPRFPLKDVEKDVRNACLEQGGKELVDSLPKLPSEIGGETHILLGIKYKRYLPVDVWISPTGLTLSKSRFLSVDGTTGVVGGPHPKFTEIMSTMNVSIFVHQVILYRSAFMEHHSMPILGEKHSAYNEVIDFPTMYLPSSDLSSLSTECQTSASQNEDPEIYCLARRPPKSLVRFEEVECAGTEVTYRCGKCRICVDCKRSSRLESISIQEEIEQELINRCVKVDIENHKTSHELPFLTDPDEKLSSMDQMAMKIYQSQVKSLEGKPLRKEAAIESEAKLQRLGFVDWFDNLEKSTKDYILSHFRYFLPWRIVENDNSLSTPTRLVFDASCCPKGGCSLNMLLAKGTNNMNKLIVILLRWSIHKVGFHTDVAKMYNVITLDKKHWRYQLYLWDEQLRVGVTPRWKVVKTAIYGVISSGNVSECGVRKVAELTREEYPKAYKTINDDLYVDDCMSGDCSVPEAHNKADQLSVSLAKGGFLLKGFTFSGENPPKDLSQDGLSILVGGLRWFSKDDVIQINIAECKSSKKLDLILSGKIPGVVTRRDCVSRAAQIFDPTGRLTPLTSGFKIDMNELCMRKLDWDDELPEDLRKIWRDNFEMMEEINSIQFKRAVVPDDAVSLDVETLDFGDASTKVICVAIYARFKRKSGGYSCQLVFSRSKVVPADTSQPRAELLALALNASTGHVVKTSFGDRHKKCLKFSDSQVALHWASCTRTSLKLWVRNKTIEINRLSNLEDLRYVDSKNMIADLGTRKGAVIDDVRQDSIWFNGYDWMSRDECEFPMRRIDELILKEGSIREAEAEKIIVKSLDHLAFHSVRNPIQLPSRYVPVSLRERYSFAQYIIDPNLFRFRKVVRILGFVMLFIQKLLALRQKNFTSVSHCSDKTIPDIVAYQGDQYLVTTGKSKNGVFKCKPGLVIELPMLMINAALRYFYVKATDEIKHFHGDKFKTISIEREGILHYSSRILPTQQFTGELNLADTSFDLSGSTFCVPLVDSLSPIAYAISNEVHWHHPDVKHGGVESMLREVQRFMYVVGGRPLIKNLKKACPKCRALEKKLIEVSMGPKPESSLCVAPAFHNTQVDLCGPFESFSNSNKKARVKIWFSVFCCSTTGAVDCKVMTSYSTDSFVLAFIRFSCRYGYPCNLYPDYGSQLLKGCKDMVLSFSDIKHQLQSEFGVKFEPCPVGGHNVHGKVERKIKEIKRSFEKELCHHRLSVIQWETLGQQVVNSINNLPIALGNKAECLENLDLITPNRLLLGRNNNRSPTEPLILSRDVKRIIQTNADIFRVWFKSWLTSCVPGLIRQPKWFTNKGNLHVGDVVLFLKNEKELESQYQYGMVSKLHLGEDGLVRSVDLEYVNHDERKKRTTTRTVRKVVVIHTVEEIGISQELFELSQV